MSETCGKLKFIVKTYGAGAGVMVDGLYAPSLLTLLFHLTDISAVFDRQLMLFGPEFEKRKDYWEKISKST